MKKYKRLLFSLMCAVMLVGVFPAGAVSHSWWQSAPEEWAISATSSLYWCVRTSTYGNTVFYSEVEPNYSLLYNPDNGYFFERVSPNTTKFSCNARGAYHVSGTIAPHSPNISSALNASTPACAWNFSIPIYRDGTDAFLGYLWPNADGMNTTSYKNSFSGNLVHPKPYVKAQADAWMSSAPNMRMRIVEPLDGSKFSGTNKIRMLVNYEYPAEYSNIQLSFEGFMDGKYTVIQDKLYPTERRQDHLGEPDNTGQNLIDIQPRAIVVEGYVEQNKPVTLTAKARAKIWWMPAAFEPYCESSVVITAYSDFVDADGDGLDDRSGRAKGDYSLSDEGFYPGADDSEAIDNPSKGDKLTTDTIDTSSLSTIFKGMEGFQSNFVAFIGQFFTFLPPQFISLIVFGMAVVIAMRIFGR